MGDEGRWRWTGETVIDTVLSLSNNGTTYHLTLYIKKNCKGLIARNECSASYILAFHSEASRYRWLGESMIDTVLSLTAINNRTSVQTKHYTQLLQCSLWITTNQFSASYIWPLRRENERKGWIGERISDRMAPKSNNEVFCDRTPRLTDFKHLKMFHFVIINC
jgi:hypothetical protein